ncbi:Glutamyl-tRNA amidotransferase subunit A, mitochondrial [Rhypophila sp. PSN 637]
MAFDPLTTTATKLQDLLAEQVTTSEAIVDQYLDQIAKYEPALKAFISVAPCELLHATARRLDEERRNGRVRSRLHGIPVVLKDCFITGPELGLETTAGSWAFVGAKAKSNATIVQRLVDAGMIVLGKTNMSEFAGIKASTAMPGWSAYRGQTLSPYVGPIEEGEPLLGHSTPGGSSTGSAVSVAAGFVPLALGAETIGSIITPASRAALYAIKPTVGVQNTQGIFCISDFFDSPGPMANSTLDLAAAMDILIPDRTFFDQVMSLKKRDAAVGRWDGSPGVAFVDPRIWKTEGDMMVRHRKGTLEQMVRAFEAVVVDLQENGCPLKYPVELEATTELTVDGEHAIMPISFWEFKNICIPRFIAAFDEASLAVHSLEDIVQFNETNKEKCLPEPYKEQNYLLRALHNTPETTEKISHLRAGLRAKARRILNRVLDKTACDIIVGPADSDLCIHAAAAGYPVATVPLSRLLYNKRPFGLCLVAGENQEHVLLRFMACYEDFLEEFGRGRAVPDLSWVQ